QIPVVPPAVRRVLTTNIGTKGVPVVRQTRCTPRRVLLSLAIFLTTFQAAHPQEKAPADVPMTRPEELLAVHETKFYHSSTFVELEGGRILHASKTTFTTSGDGGVTWSEPFECKDTNGNPVGGEGSSLVKLSGRGIGLAAIEFYDPKN